MNILLFSSSNNTSGGSRQALYLAQGMAQRGHKVLFFVSRKAALPSLAPGAPFWRYFDDFADLRRNIEELLDGTTEPFVIHAFHNKAVKRAAWWGLFWRKRAVITAHRGVIFRPNNPFPYWSPGIDGFLVNSMACAKVIGRMGVSKKRLFYVPNCIPDERLATTAPPDVFRSGLGIPEDALLYLCIAGNALNKGVEELLQAFARAFPPAAAPAANAPPPHLLVVGTEDRRFPALAKAFELHGRIHFTGKTEDIGDCLAAAQVFVLPSRSESMPNTLLEAIRAGLPCIATSVGAVPDILSGCGVLVPPQDIPALSAGLRELYDNRALREDLAARSLAQGDKYSPRRRLELVEGIYRQLLQRKGLSDGF